MVDFYLSQKRSLFGIIVNVYLKDSGLKIKDQAKYNPRKTTIFTNPSAYKPHFSKNETSIATIADVIVANVTGTKSSSCLVQL